MSEQQTTPPGPRLENRLPAEGINSSDEHPLKEFAWLMGASIVAVVLLSVCLIMAARWLAPYTPFSVEVMLAERFVDRPEKPENAKRSAALQVLANNVAAHMGMPKDMEVVVRFDESPVVNAYATLGGRIVIFDGLMRKLDHEDALAALLAHEIAHVKHRDVAASMGQGLALALLLGMVSADAGAAVAQAALGQVANLAMLDHSREREAQADSAAASALVSLYGHTQGMEVLFTQLDTKKAAHSPPFDWFRSHPLTPARLAAVRELARQRGWPTTGSLTPLPAALARKPSK